MANIGTYEWAKRTKGILTTGEKLKYLGMAAKMEFTVRLDYLIFPRSWTKRIDLERIRLPDSAIVNAATEHAAAECSVPLLRHCHRMFFWGSMLAQVEQKTIDPELFAVGCLLHDAGLTGKYIKQSKCSCFAVVGAEEAEKFLMSHGLPSEKITLVYESISAHLNPVVNDADFSAEARYINHSAFFDIFGKRHHRIPKELTLNVLAQYPFSGINAEIQSTVGLHAKSSRIDLLSPVFGFMVALNPLWKLDAPREEKK